MRIRRSLSLLIVATLLLSALCGGAASLALAESAGLEKPNYYYSFPTEQEMQELRPSDISDRKAWKIEQGKPLEVTLYDLKGAFTGVRFQIDDRETQDFQLDQYAQTFSIQTDAMQGYLKVYGINAGYEPVALACVPLSINGERGDSLALCMFRIKHAARNNKVASESMDGDALQLAWEGDSLDFFHDSDVETYIIFQPTGGNADIQQYEDSGSKAYVVEKAPFDAVNGFELVLNRGPYKMVYNFKKTGEAEDEPLVLAPPTCIGMKIAKAPPASAAANASAQSVSETEQDEVEVAAPPMAETAAQVEVAVPSMSEAAEPAPEVVQPVPEPAAEPAPEVVQPVPEPAAEPAPEAAQPAPEAAQTAP
ncbi:MAG: hypothetical protein IJV64_02190, partial [Oscillospiraceae bacterium]|nr:hypothetical protein [Oscillospiraceae bacterium]